MADQIKNAIKAMLALRAAKMDSNSIGLYTARLSKENPIDVVAVLQRLGEAERGEYETAVPDIATILKLVSVERIARENRMEAAKNKRLVCFQCPDCKTTCNGWYAPNDDVSNVRCKGNPKGARKWNGNPNERPICGARLIAVFDENNEKADEGPLTKWEMPEALKR